MNHESTQLLIDKCSSECDLGAIFDSNLLFLDHVDKADQTLGIMKKNILILK